MDFRDEGDLITMSTAEVSGETTSEYGFYFPNTGLWGVFLNKGGCVLGLHSPETSASSRAVSGVKASALSGRSGGGHWSRRRGPREASAEVPGSEPRARWLSSAKLHCPGGLASKRRDKAQVGEGPWGGVATDSVLWPAQQAQQLLGPT